ncbi:MAG: hypothetical protein A2Y98_03850 [Candidatus Portnoybacteria bacterium RBG_19FT_COMBO_36_7]|uniref:HTH arsR-type domain-containing protein n=1 Tax=Candidatus Portnoybacteria bacterium RBG_19FT_COMBO_36_7 TaxID=1801992 RepID=A0A1G2F8L6_9BACT|nr:MAG: hypothetical protein A2Y98_03850 [Candidatus Portnoybacteria bacterium RBG_19FT_COMBO_36_7]
MSGKERSFAAIFCLIMVQQVLEILFDSPVKVRLLKLFLRNPDKFFHEKEIAKRIQSDSRLVGRQIKGLFDIGFLKKRKVTKKKKDAKKGIYYSANSSFGFYNELRSLVLKSSPASKEKILRNVLKLGRIKLLLLAGIFLNTNNSRVDLFVIGDEIKQAKASPFLKNLESEVGKEISFAFMNTKEFYYRYHMFDRFVHDILEKPHEKLIDKLKV